MSDTLPQLRDDPITPSVQRGLAHIDPIRADAVPVVYDCRAGEEEGDEYGEGG
jgi:hypothetical protein